MGTNVGVSAPVSDAGLPSGSSSGSKKKRGNKGKSTVNIDDTDNLLIPGRAECECQGNHGEKQRGRGG
jgi:hypothetical protein